MDFCVLVNNICQIHIQIIDIISKQYIIIAISILDLTCFKPSPCVFSEVKAFYYIILYACSIVGSWPPAQVYGVCVNILSHHSCRRTWRTWHRKHMYAETETSMQRQVTRYIQQMLNYYNLGLVVPAVVYTVKKGIGMQRCRR